MTAPLLINGRFLANLKTAVNRVAFELTEAMLAERPAGIAVAVPQALAAQAEALGWPVEVSGTRKGILWEQTSLPGMARGRPVFSFFNTVPIFGGSNYVTLLHDAYVFERDYKIGEAARQWRKFLSVRAGAYQRRVVTISDYSRDKLLAFRVAPPERISVVHNGVDHLDRIVPDTETGARLGLDAPFFVALSNTLPHKNIGLLLRAFARPELADARLVLTGARTRADFEAAGMTVPGNVVFAGFVSDGALRHIYETAEAYCMPSKVEGFGLPPVEAMWFGTPAIVAPCGALPEVCGKAAAYAEPDDVDAWTSAMVRILQDTDHRNALRERSRAHARQFTWQRAARLMLTVVPGV